MFAAVVGVDVDGRQSKLFRLAFLASNAAFPWIHGHEVCEDATQAATRQSIFHRLLRPVAGGDSAIDCVLKAMASNGDEVGVVDNMRRWIEDLVAAVQACGE